MPRLVEMAAAALAGLAAYAVALEPIWLETVRTEVPIAGLPKPFDGLRVGVLGDLHAGGWVGRDVIERAVDALRREAPHLVLLPGDLATAWARPRSLADLAPLADLKPPLGKLAVLGGHDHKAGAARIVEALGRLGCRVLQNEAVALERAGARIWVAGVDDNSWRSARDDLGKACRDVPEGDTLVAVAHAPDLIHDPLRERVDLVVCGHTHGGQVRMPGVGALVRVSDVPLRYSAGLSRHGRTWLYVTRGVGSTYRLRFNCRPEASLLVLCAR